MKDHFRAFSRSAVVFAYTSLFLFLPGRPVEPARAPLQMEAEGQLEAYYDVYHRYAHENNLPLVDTYPTWGAIAKPRNECML